MEFTTIPGPVEVTFVTQRLNSLLPQVSAETLNAVLDEICAEPDPQKQHAIVEERMELFRRENFVLYHALAQSFPAQVVSAVAFTYRVLAAQAQKDTRFPA